MPRSRHHRKRRAGTKKRGRRGGLAYSSRASPSLSEVQLSKSMRPVSPPMRPVSPPPMKSVSRPPMKPVSPLPQRKVSPPSASSFKKAMGVHATNAGNALTGIFSGLVEKAKSAVSSSSGGRKSRRRRTHKRRSRVRKVRKHKTYKKRKHKRRRH